jgi:hypothetical protein
MATWCRAAAVSYWGLRRRSDSKTSQVYETCEVLRGEQRYFCFLDTLRASTLVERLSLIEQPTALINAKRLVGDPTPLVVGLVSPLPGLGMNPARRFKPPHFKHCAH